MRDKRLRYLPHFGQALVAAGMPQLELVKWLNGPVVAIGAGKTVTIIRLLYPRTLTVSIAARQCYSIVTLEDVCLAGLSLRRPRKPRP
jgi:hypothetical protein